MIYAIVVDSMLLVVCILCLKFKIYFPGWERQDRILNYVLIFASTVNLTLTLYRTTNL